MTQKSSNRELTEAVRGSGKTSGVVPFLRVQDSLTLAISQGNLRRGSSAVYMPIDHQLTGTEALKMLLDGKIIYDVYGIEYELCDCDILQKYQKLNGKEYYVQCPMGINTFLKQTFYKDKK